MKSPSSQLLTGGPAPRPSMSLQREDVSKDARGDCASKCKVDGPGCCRQWSIAITKSYCDDWRQGLLPELELQPLHQ